VLAKLERFDWEIEQRLIIGKRYNEWIDSAGLKRVQQRPDRTSVFAQYTMLLDQREDVQKRLSELGIPTAVHYPIPLNEQPAYKHLCCPDCTPAAQAVSKRVMSLPMGSNLSGSDQRFITERVRSAVS
jgi:UDP-2-acetamido-2-deoxy-ribo-hexuluronate aminotransferase